MAAPIAPVPYLTKDEWVKVGHRLMKRASRGESVVDVVQWARNEFNVPKFQRTTVERGMARYASTGRMHGKPGQLVGFG